MANIIDIALAEEGYLEKKKQYVKDNAILDSKTEGAGKDNVTKYWRDIYPSFQGQAWCQAFVVWCMVQVFGLAKAKNIMCCSTFTYSCGQQISFYKSKGKFKTKDPKPQDQIFFKDSKGNPCHTGIVWKVENGKVYTIEGNTSSKSGVVENGGAVATKSYQLNYSRIYGYGTPLTQNTTPIENKPLETPKKSSRRVLQYACKGEDVKELHKVLRNYKYGVSADNDLFDMLTKSCIVHFQTSHNLKVDGIVGDETYKALGY